MRISLCVALAAALSFMQSPSIAASAYPVKPVRIVTNEPAKWTKVIKAGGIKEGR